MVGYNWFNAESVYRIVDGTNITCVVFYNGNFHLTIEIFTKVVILFKN